MVLEVDLRVRKKLLGASLYREVIYPRELMIIEKKSLMITGSLNGDDYFRRPQGYCNPLYVKRISGLHPMSQLYQERY